MTTVQNNVNSYSFETNWSLLLSAILINSFASLILNLGLILFLLRVRLISWVSSLSSKYPLLLWSYTTKRLSTIYRNFFYVRLIPFLQINYYRISINFEKYATYLPYELKIEIYIPWTLSKNYYKNQYTSVLILQYQYLSIRIFPYELQYMNKHTYAFLLNLNQSAVQIFTLPTL